MRVVVNKPIYTVPPITYDLVGLSVDQFLMIGKLIGTAYGRLPGEMFYDLAVAYGSNEKMIKDYEKRFPVEGSYT